ncbi:unnamed protein product [Boreogadus saida]
MLHATKVAATLPYRWRVLGFSRHHTNQGVIRYWQTPFGPLRNHGNRGDLDPALSMLSDGSLFIANASVHHSGLYYCLLVAKSGTTLWPYQVNIGLHNSPDRQMAPGSSTKPGFRQDPVQSRSRTDPVQSRSREDPAGSGQAGVTNSVFAGAVVASVLLTFVVGFSAGVLSQPQVLRCLRVVSGKIQSLRRGPPTGRGCQVTMTTLEVPDNSCVFYDESDSDRGETTLDSTRSSSPPWPPKPQRSCRHKSGEQPWTAAPLEGRGLAQEDVQRTRAGEGEEEVEERMKERKEGEPEEGCVEARRESREKEKELEERRESREEEKEMEVRRESRKEKEMDERRESRKEEKEMEERRDSRKEEKEMDEGRESRKEEKEMEERRDSMNEEKEMEERRESRKEEKEMEERRERESREKEKEMEVRRDSRKEEKEMEVRRESREKGNREGEKDEKEVEERLKERSRVGETDEVGQLIEERSNRRAEEENTEGEPGEKEMEEVIVERRGIREGEAGVTWQESRASGERSPTVTTTEGSSEAGGRGGTGRKSNGMAEGEEVVVEGQMETSSTGEVRQKEGGGEGHGDVSSEDDDNSDSSSDAQDEEKREKGKEGREQVDENDQGAEGTAKSGVARGRRSRVIRLYQYDDEGQRYSHLPSPASIELDPAPRLKQRSLSLTRLSSIMAAATAGPLTLPSGGPGLEERCPSPPFSPAPFFNMDL